MSLECLQTTVINLTHVSQTQCHHHIQAHPSINTSLCDLMELIKSQNEELKLMSSKLQQQAQLESCLRTANLQIDVLSKEVRLLSASLERIQAASSVNILNGESMQLLNF